MKNPATNKLVDALSAAASKLGMTDKTNPY
ncbi:hypothetical protein MHYMCMPSP_01022 [Hyalomma marginatum]|uniref:Uncharacterized protein n=1 Tax=Hyalomma marginatum TaxID=34627 RepID=A0A8S4BXU0_9ACAR|nr:hypothetical protein MHYMCMPSP_01022 [Hyalomma marginatum]CAG7597391.1 hypothetical protein MHYMCMPASI_00934 [Hyalomma marginatum]